MECGFLGMFVALTCCELSRKSLTSFLELILDRSPLCSFSPGYDLFPFPREGRVYVVPLMLLHHSLVCLGVNYNFDVFISFNLLV